MLLLLIPAALAFDHAPLQQTLTAYVDGSGRVNYAAVHETGALDGYLTALASAAEPAAGPARMAFWINAYNALTIDMMADNWPIASIRDLDNGNPWDARTFTVAGRQVTLNDIEHKILRPMGDPRIHAAVNCASRGCPPLPASAFTAAALDAQLTAASRRWITTNGVRIDANANTVKLNQIFDWYGDDFVPGANGDIPGVDGKQEAALLFAAGLLAEDQAAWLRAGGYN